MPVVQSAGDLLNAGKQEQNMRNRLLILAILVTIAGGIGGTAAAQAVPLPKADLVMWLQETPEAIQKLGIQKTFDAWAATNAPGSSLVLLPKIAETLEDDFRSADTATSPDLLWTAADFIPPFAASHLIRPVDDIVDARLFLPTITYVAQVSGQTYGIPLQVGNHLMLYYNKKMVKEPPKTFTDLMKISKDLAAQHTADTAANQFVPFAYNQWDAFWVFPVAHGFGAVEFGPDHKSPALDSDGWVKTYDLLQQLKFTDKLGTDPCDFECADRRFRAGTTAMILSVDWTLYGDQGYIKVLGDDLGIAPWPSVGNDPTQNIPAPFVSGMYLLIPQPVSGAKLQVASAFARFLATDEASILKRTLPVGRLPALLSVLTGDRVAHDPIFAISSSVVLTGVAQPVQPEWNCVWQAVSKQNKLVMQESTTPANAAKNAQKFAVDCISKLATPVN